MRVLLVPPDTDPRAVDVPNDVGPAGPALEALQQLVGGYIAVVFLTANTVLVHREFDTEAEESAELRNRLAQALTGLPLHGTVLLAGTDSDRITSVPEEWIRQLQVR